MKLSELKCIERTRFILVMERTRDWRVEKGNFADNNEPIHSQSAKHC